MKFKLLIILVFIYSCSPKFQTIKQKNPYVANGFAYIYNDSDFNQKIIKNKMNNEIMQLSHQYLKTGTLIKITNPKNQESLILKNIKRIKYPDFYKIMITKPVAQKLNLRPDLPLLEIIEIKKINLLLQKKQKFLMKRKKFHQKLQLLQYKYPIYQNKSKKIQK